MILLNITHICNTICSLQCFQRIYWFIWLTEKRVHADFLCLCQLKKKKKKSNVTHVKEISNIRFRSCSVNAAREELLSLKPGSSHPTTQTVQRSGTGKPRLIYLASKRRVEDTADRERESLIVCPAERQRILLGSSGFHSGGFAPGLHHPPHMCHYSSFLTSGKMSLSCSRCSRLDPAWRDSRTSWLAAR